MGGELKGHRLKEEVIQWYDEEKKRGTTDRRLKVNKRWESNGAKS